MIEQTPKWKKNFFAIWTGQAVSLITSAILQMAIIYYLTEKTQSAMVLSIASLVGLLPFAVFGPWIGVLVDRHDRKKIMIIADLINAVAGLALFIIALYTELPVWMVMVVLFIRSIGTAFHSPALSATTPLLVPEEYLTKCAGYTQSMQSISYIISPAIAAFLYSIWDLNFIILIDVLGAIIACTTVAFIYIPKLDVDQKQLKKNFMAEMKDGFFALKENKGVFTVLLVGTVYMLIYMPMNVLFPLISTSYFNGTSVHVSIAQMAFSTGMLVGGILLGIIGGHKKKVFFMFMSILIVGLSLTISGLLPSKGFIVFAICCGVMGLSVPFYSGAQTALIQEKIKVEYLGRVFSLTGGIMSMVIPIGLIPSGFLADKVGVNYLFVISGILIIIIAIIFPIIPSIRELDQK
jgi:MFS transporter, DHA3 family, macrolide efflux protein